MKLTKQKFRDLCQQVALLASEHQIDALYLKIQQVLDSDKVPANTQAFIAAYYREYALVFGSRPIPSEKDLGMARGLVNRIGHEKAIELLKTYLSMKEGWFIHRGHDLTTFVSNINRVVQKHEGRHVPTSGEIRQIERRQTNANAFAGLLAEATKTEDSDGSR